MRSGQAQRSTRCRELTVSATLSVQAEASRRQLTAYEQPHGEKTAAKTQQLNGTMHHYLVRVRRYCKTAL